MPTVLTKKGREIIAAALHNQTSGGGAFAEPKNIGWGTNPAALSANANDISPFTEATEARVAGTATINNFTLSTNDTYQVVGTMTVAGSGKTIGEVFLATSTTAPTPIGTLAAAGSQTGGSFASFNGGGTTIVFNASYSPGNHYLQCRNEVWLVTAGSGTATLTVTRAQNGTSSGTTFAAGDIVTPGNPPGDESFTGGDLLLHGDFTGLALNVSDSIQFTIKLSFS